MTNYFLRLFFFLGIISGIVACVADPGFPDEPVIEYINMSKNQMVQSDLSLDSLLLRFSFTDGDGDIGDDQRSFEQNVIVTDNRTGNLYDGFKLPTIPTQGASKGISGEVTLRIFTTCCLFPNNIPPCEAPEEFPTDTLTLSIQMIDRGDNVSNIITTEQIIILCD